MQFIKWIGHFHPAMTAFPIALVITAALAELLRTITGATWLQSAARFCVIIAGISAAITAPLGWAFAIGHESTTILELHRWLGTIGAVWLICLLIVSEISQRRGGGWRKAYLAGVFLAVPAVGAIGFLGGAMVYGIHEYDWNTASAVESPSKPNNVSMTNEMTFDPKAITITVGETIVWTNPSKDTHTVTADAKLASDARDVALPAGAESFNSGDVKPGSTFSHTFTVPGTYKYFCIPHEGMGMRGTVQVEAKK